MKSRVESVTSASVGVESSGNAATAAPRRRLVGSGAWKVPTGTATGGGLNGATTAIGASAGGCWRGVANGSNCGVTGTPGTATATPARTAAAISLVA